MLAAGRPSRSRSSICPRLFQVLIRAIEKTGRREVSVLRRLVRAAFYRLRYGARPTRSVRISRNVAGGFVDDLTLHGDRVAAVHGWARDLGAFRNALALRFDECEIPALHAFRVYRAELALPGAGGPFGDVVVEWILPPAAGRATLTAQGRVLATVRVPASAEPAYAFLRDARDVAHRGQIYGLGRRSTPSPPRFWISRARYSIRCLTLAVEVGPSSARCVPRDERSSGWSSTTSGFASTCCPKRRRS